MRVRKVIPCRAVMLVFFGAPAPVLQRLDLVSQAHEVGIGGPLVRTAMATCVQASWAQLAVEGEEGPETVPWTVSSTQDEAVVARLAKAREVERDVSGLSPKAGIARNDPGSSSSPLCASREPVHASFPASELSPHDILQHLAIQCGMGHDALWPRILVLELLEPTHLVP